MNTRFLSLIVIIALSLIPIMACSNGNTSDSNPLMPNMNGAIADTSPGGAAQTGASESGHNLWGWFMISIDPATNEFEIIPVRQTSAHWNILSFLEESPCDDCFRIVKIENSGYGTLLVDIEIEHPFQNANLTGFDVRGIAMFDASADFPTAGLTYSDRSLGDGEIVNSDGYTSLYNSTTEGCGPNGLEGYIKGKYSTEQYPDALLNGYKRFISDDPANTRNAFYAGDIIKVTYDIDMPEGGFVFGYAVDASWLPPTKKPVEDPMEDFPPGANSPEPWKIVITELGPGLNTAGGYTQLLIDVYDWQGKDSHSLPLVECPELYSGALTAGFEEDGFGYTRYKLDIEHGFYPPAGIYKCLVSVEDNENDPVAKPWLDLTAYQIIPLEVSQGITLFNPEDVTPLLFDMIPHDSLIVGDLIYVTGVSTGLHVFDITDMDDPRWLNSIDTPGSAYGIAVNDGYAYVADEVGGLQIIDVDPLESAHIVNSVAIPGQARDVVVSNEYAYIAADTGMHIIDINPITEAQIVKSVDCEVNSIAGNIDCIYVTDWYDGLHVIDVNPVEKAGIIKTIDTPGGAQDCMVSNGYVYVADGVCGLQIIDPVAGEIIKGFSMIPDFYFGVDVVGSYVYMATQKGLQIIDFTVFENPILASVMDIEGEGQSVSVNGAGYAYLALDTARLTVIDVSTAETPVIAANVDAPDLAYDVALDGDYAYVADDTLGGLFIIDISTPEESIVVGQVDTPEYAAGVSAHDGYVYVADMEGGLQIISAGDPSTAHIVGHVATPDDALDVEYSNGYAYVACNEGGLLVIDVDPISYASIVQTVAVTGKSNDVKISGNYAYVASFSTGESYSGLAIIDISTPESAFEVNSVTLDGNAHGVCIDGGYAYMSDQGAGLQIVDIDPPKSAYVVNSVVTPGCAGNTAVSNGYAFTAVWGHGMSIIDIDPPESAFIVKTFDTPGCAEDIRVSGQYAYVADISGGMRVIKLF